MSHRERMSVLLLLLAFSATLVGCREGVETPSHDQDDATAQRVDASESEDGAPPEDLDAAAEPSDSDSASDAPDTSSIDGARAEDASMANDAAVDLDAPAQDATADASANASDAAAQSDTQVPHAPGTCASGFPTDALFDVAHTTRIRRLRVTEQRIVSHDGSRWVLWDTATRARVAHGDVTCVDTCPVTNCQGEPICDSLELRGGLLVVRTGIGTLTPGFQLRDAQDGHVLGSISGGTTSYGIAADGSYVWTASGGGLQVWSPRGEMRLQRPGDYTNAKVFAAADTLHVAQGAAGPQVIEQLVLGSGESRVSPAFSGQFRAWFADQPRFITMSGVSQGFVYSSAGVQEKMIGSFTRYIGGAGEFYWGVYLDFLSVHRVSAGTAISATIPFPDGSVVYATEGGPVVVNRDQSQATAFDVRAAVPGVVRYTIPAGQFAAFAWAPDGGWIAGTPEGVVHRQPPGASSSVPLNCGMVRSIVASAGSTFAVAVSAGQILIVNAAEQRIVSALPFAAQQLMLNDLGTRLAAFHTEALFRSQSDRTLRLYRLPEGDLEREIASRSDMPPYLASFALSRDGSRLARATCSPSSELAQEWPCELSVTDAVGATEYLRVNELFAYGYPALHVSPNGRRLAASGGGGITLNAPTGVTRLYVDAAASGTTDGLPALWLEDDRLLVEGQGTGLTRLLNGQGAVLQSIAGLPSLRSGARALDGGQKLFVASTNTVHELPSGTTLWRGPAVGLSLAMTPLAAANERFAAQLRGRQVFVGPR